jgi:hypothetical protein
MTKKESKDIFQKDLEIPGFEPGAFRMQSGRAATALYPRRMCQWSYQQEPSLQMSYVLTYLYCMFSCNGRAANETSACTSSLLAHEMLLMQAAAAALSFAARQTHWCHVPVLNDHQIGSKDELLL